MGLPLFNGTLAAFPERLLAIGALFTVEGFTRFKAQHQQQEEANHQFCCFFTPFHTGQVNYRNFCADYQNTVYVMV